MEMVDLYDENRLPLGRTAERYAPKGEGEYRVVVHICVFDSRGRLLIQQRSREKAVWPEAWDVSAAGQPLCRGTQVIRDWSLLCSALRGNSLRFPYIMHLCAIMRVVRRLRPIFFRQRAVRSRQIQRIRIKVLVFLQHVERRKYWLRAISDQPVGPGISGADDITGDGEHISALLQRTPRRDEGATFFSRLNHDRSAADAGQEPVADRKGRPAWQRTGWKFADNRAMPGDRFPPAMNR